MWTKSIPKEAPQKARLLRQTEGQGVWLEEGILAGNQKGNVHKRSACVCCLLPWRRDEASWCDEQCGMTPACCTLTQTARGERRGPSKLITPSQPQCCLSKDSGHPRLAACLQTLSLDFEVQKASAWHHQGRANTSHSTVINISKMHVWDGEAQPAPSKEVTMGHGVPGRGRGSFGKAISRRQ